MRKVPLWMAISVIVMILIGLLAGYDFLYILKAHFLIGCGIAFFIWLCFYFQIKSTSIKKVRKIYENAIEKIAPEEKEIFIDQIEKEEYDTVTFQNPTSDKYPARLLVGKEYWIYCRYPNCIIIKANEVDKIDVKNETTRVGYNVGDRHVQQNISVGVSFIISYKNKEKEDIIFLGNEKQVKQVKELIQKYEIENAKLFV